MISNITFSYKLLIVSCKVFYLIIAYIAGVNIPQNTFGNIA